MANEIDPASGRETTFEKAGRKLVWIVPLAIWLGSTVYVISERPIVAHDEYNYANHSRWLHGVLHDVLRPAPSDGRSLRERVAGLGDPLFNFGRLPYFFPAAMVATALKLPWSLDLYIVLNSGIYLAVLFASLAGLARVLPVRRGAFLGGAGCCLALSPQVWQSSATLMGDLPLVAVLMLTACSWARVTSRGKRLDFALLGVSLGWGLLVKPVFVLLSLPMLFHVGVLIVRRCFPRQRTSGRFTRSSTLSGALMMVALALPVLVLSWDRLVRESENLYVIHEVMLSFGASESVAHSASFAIQYFTELFPRTMLILLAPLWIVALIHPSGRRVWLAVVPLFLYMTFVLDYRTGRAFLGFIAGFAALTGIGLSALPGKGRLAAGGALIAASLVTTVGFTADSQWLTGTVLRQEVAFAGVGDGGHLEWNSYVTDPPLLRRGDEYRLLRIPDVVEATGTLGDPAVSVHVAFDLRRLNGSAYQSWLLLEGGTEPGRSRFFPNVMRYGGFGQPGGLSPLFFTADFVLAKTGAVADFSLDTRVYPELVHRELLATGSSWQGGLELVRRFELADGDAVLLARRVRPVTGGELLEIMNSVRAVDGDNPWNTRYARPIIEHALSIGDEATAKDYCRWVLAFQEEGALEPRLSSSIPYAYAFEELTRLFDDACRHARDALERLESGHRSSSAGDH